MFSMHKSRPLSLLVFLLVIILVIIPGCGGNGGDGKIFNVAVTPAEVTLEPGGTQQFEATISATGSISTDVTWSVVTPNGGIIDQSGFYQAPLVAGQYYIKANSVADSTKSAQAKVIVVGGVNPVKKYEGTITIKNTGTGTREGGQVVTINQDASLKVTIPEVAGTFMAFQLKEVTASVDDSYTDENGTETIKGSVISATIEGSIILIIKDTTYDLFIGPVMIPCVITNKDGSTMGNYPVLGKHIINYPKPTDPSRLTGIITQKMEDTDFSFATQEITWDLQAIF